MMAQFYARYVPPSRNSTTAAEGKPPATEKRRRTESEAHEAKEDGKRRKKRKVTEATTTEDNDPVADIDVHDTVATDGSANGQSIIGKYSISQFARSQDNNVQIDTGRKAHPNKSKSDFGIAKDEDKVAIRSREKPGPVDSDRDVDRDKKHTDVLNKYEKSRKRSDLSGRDDGGLTKALEEPELLVQHGLVPLPQPKQADIKIKTPTYSTLPQWQAAATKVSPLAGARLEDLGLDGRILSNLKSGGVKQAFPIQSTVMPLLMPGKQSYPGDLCVSAATGSGKTLAYVVPIVESLRKQRTPGLRAVIVVPTRELVNQVRETCELCASGSHLRIATALGSKSLTEEQKTLVLEEHLLDPEAYQRELKTPMDWTAFSLEKTLLRAQNRDLTKVTNYVTKRTSKADILITTPGRLVDHLQNTEGFHLDDVSWLVVDEADRLLDESYQEWIDVVVPALQTRKATEKRDRVLSHMRMDLPPRIVRKVLLSATMTRDVSKLNQIGLDNPRLVVLDSAVDNTSHVKPRKEQDNNLEEPATDATGKYTLPTSLYEVVVALKEDADKPLVLLQILDSHIKIKPHESQKADFVTGNDASPRSDTVTSDEDNDTTSSSENSSSDSETDADSSSISTKSSRGSAQEDDLPAIRKQAPGLTPSYNGHRVLIFTRSTASASRLSRLISLLSPTLAPLIATLTRSTSASASSRKALTSFRSGKTPILIATDRASRGIDVPGLEHVISYDIPGGALTYVHRVGRTARAGKVGTAWTLVEHREGRWFSNEIGGKSRDSMIQRSAKLQKVTLTVDDEGLKEKYEEALKILGSEVRGE